MVETEVEKVGPPKEISDILKKPIGTVGVLVKRAKEQFKKIVEKENINF